MKKILVLIVAGLGFFLMGCASGTLKQASLNLDEFKYLVVPPNQNSWDKMAEQELHYYFHKITGRNLKTVKERNPSGGNLFLGTPALAAGLLEAKAVADIKEDGDGFSVASDGTDVAIYSKNSIGSIYGVYAFFEKLGLKIYANDCEVLPPANVAVPKFKLTSNPDFSRFAMAFNFYHYEVFKIEDLTRLGYSPTLGGSVMAPNQPSLTVGPGWTDPVYAKHYGISDITSHTTGFLVPPYLYLEKHPEYYARDKSGKVSTDLKSPYTVQLCLSNPDVFKIVLERMLYWMGKTPAAKYYEFTCGDNWDYCQCPECEKLDPQDVPTFPGEKRNATDINAVSHMSDRVLWFTNKLAREIRKHYPDKIILSTAYQATVEPPRLIKEVASNVGIQLCSEYCGGAQSQSYDLFSPPNERFLRHFLKWKQLAPEQLYMFEYPMNYGNVYAPFFSHDAARNKVKFYYGQGVKGVEYCGQPFLFTKMFVYVQGKLRWNATQPADKLEGDFLKAYYGPAAGAMQDFLNLIRAKIYDKNHPVHQVEWGTGSALISPDFVSQAYAIFAQAEHAVKATPLFYDRVRYEKLCGVLWGDLAQRITQNETQRFFRLKELADICRSAPDKRSVRGVNSGTGISMVEWLKKEFSIALPYDAEATWYDAPLIKKLSACENEKELTEFINGLNKAPKAGQ